MIRFTGAEMIVKLLERQGIQRVAGIPGGANLPLYDALSRQHRIQHVLTRHEQGAGFVAQGMARLTGRPQVCLATSGPGATNLLTAVADAKMDSVPLVCITGQVPRTLLGTDAFQEVDTYGLSLPITKHNYLVRSPEDLLKVIPEAFRIAASGRPGPVLVDVPKDVQTAAVELGDWPAPGQPDPPPVFDLKDLKRAARMISHAQRPILYVGGGLIGAGASDKALDLAEKAGLPTVMTLMGLGAIPPDHDLCLGMLGMHAAPHANLAMAECDLLIAMGVRFDDRATGRLASFCPHARVVHMDIDPCEIHKLRPADVGVVGDLNLVLEALIPLVPARRRSDWRSRVATLKQAVLQNRVPPADHPAAMIQAIASQLDPETIIVTDVGQHQMWVAQHYPFRKPRRFLTSGGLGTMGFGLPTAIGAALVEPDRPVVCVSGDGSLLMNIQELATAAELGVDLKIVLMNNQGLGLVRQQQELFYEQRLFASDYALAIDFVNIARGFGIEALAVHQNHMLCAALAEALDHKGPCLVHVPVDSRQGVYPMVPPGAANTEMIEGDCHAAA